MRNNTNGLNTLNEWEKEFDEKYWIYFVKYCPEKEKGLFGNIKSFISNAIQQALSAREEELVKKIDGKKPARDEQMSFKLGYLEAKKEVIALIKG